MVFLKLVGLLSLPLIFASARANEPHPYQKARCALAADAATRNIETKLAEMQGQTQLAEQVARRRLAELKSLPTPSFLSRLLGAPHPHRAEISVTREEIDNWQAYQKSIARYLSLVNQSPQLLENIRSASPLLEQDVRIWLLEKLYALAPRFESVGLPRSGIIDRLNNEVAKLGKLFADAAQPPNHPGRRAIVQEIVNTQLKNIDDPLIQPAERIIGRSLGESRLHALFAVAGREPAQYLKVLEAFKAIDVWVQPLFQTFSKAYSDDLIVALTEIAQRTKNTPQNTGRVFDRYKSKLPAGTPETVFVYLTHLELTEELESVHETYLAIRAATPQLDPNGWAIATAEFHHQRRAQKISLSDFNLTFRESVDRWQKLIGKFIDDYRTYKLDGAQIATLFAFGQKASDKRLENIARLSFSLRASSAWRFKVAPSPIEYIRFAIHCEAHQVPIDVAANLIGWAINDLQRIRPTEAMDSGSVLAVAEQYLTMKNIFAETEYSEYTDEWYTSSELELERIAHALRQEKMGIYSDERILARPTHVFRTNVLKDVAGSIAVSLYDSAASFRRQIAARLDYGTPLSSPAALQRKAAPNRSKSQKSPKSSESSESAGRQADASASGSLPGAEYLPETRLGYSAEEGFKAYLDTPYGVGIDLEDGSLTTRVGPVRYDTDGSGVSVNLDPTAIANSTEKFLRWLTQR